MTTPDTPNEDYPGWYAQWRGRIHEWVASRVDPTLADLLFLVPDLFILLLNLLRDGRIPLESKAKISMVLAYVLLPVDFMPESVLGVMGLADDAAAMVLLLTYLKSLGDQHGEVLRQYWHGKGEVGAVVDQLHSTLERNAEKFMGGKVWAAVKNRFDFAPKEEDATPAKKQRVDISFD